MYLILYENGEKPILSPLLKDRWHHSMYQHGNKFLEHSHMAAWTTLFHQYMSLAFKAHVIKGIGCTHPLLFIPGTV